MGGSVKKITGSIGLGGPGSKVGAAGSSGGVRNAIGKGGVNASNAGADALSQIASSLYSQTAPNRKLILDRQNQFLKGNLDVTNTPMFGALKNATDQQFGRAEENILANTAGGGALTAALAGNEYAKANTLTQGIGNIAQDEYNKAFGFATGAPGQAMQGLGSAASAQASQAYAQAQDNASRMKKFGDAKSGAGRAAGGGK